MRDVKQRPRVGIPYRTRNEELSRVRAKFEKYARSVEEGGGMPVEISLGLPANDLRTLTRSLDAVVLPGSPADVNPSLYHCARHQETKEADADREETDFVLLEHAFAVGKPVLAICYGIQILNVFLGGTLIQDIPSEMPAALQHSWVGSKEGMPEPFHETSLQAGSRIAKLSGASEVKVNSSHHQAILEPGRSLRIVGRAPDGVTEAVEWTGDSNWVTGVQWHPERMTDDALAQTLFRELVAAARSATVRA